MAVSMNKLPPRYAVSDWVTSNKILTSNAEKLRDSSHAIRQEARRLHNETDNHTRWTQHDSNTKLEKRVDDINEWKESLERCLRDTDNEIKALQEQKSILEVALEAKKLHLDVAIECLMLRENREGIDLVRDKVEQQLHKEVEVIEGIKALLQQKIAESFEQLCLLEEARHQLHCDLTDKNHALQIDGACHVLNNRSKNIDFQVNPTRTVNGSVTPETWNAFSQYNKHRGEAEMKASQCLREAIFATLEKTTNDLNAQHRSTEFEYRKRIHETEQAKNELEWQQKNTKDEIATMEQDIQALKEAIEDKMAPMKVAQTRLEIRTHRKNVELCRDIPQYQLCHEVGEIDGSIKALLEKLNVAENALLSLLQDLQRIEDDLVLKTKSLELDNMCMKVRQKIKDSSAMPAAKIVEAQSMSDGMAQLSMQEKAAVAEGAEPSSVRVGGEVDTSQFAHTPYVPPTAEQTSAQYKSSKQNDLMKSTYNFDFDEMKSKRSGDMQRTLGKSTYEIEKRSKHLEFA